MKHKETEVFTIITNYGDLYQVATMPDKASIALLCPLFKWADIYNAHAYLCTITT